MYEQIAANKRRTVLLIVGAVVFLGLIGYAIGVFWGGGPTGLIIALVVAGALSIGSYFYGDKIVLASTRADVNGLVRRLLDVRKASFLAMDLAVEVVQYYDMMPLVMEHIGRVGADKASATGTLPGLARPTNRAGGLEGGVTNGEDVRVTAVMKPISTLMNPLRSVDLTSMDESPAAIERSDVCAVPAAAVVGEAMVAFILAEAFLEKFGGDTIADARAALTHYVARISDRLGR